MTPDKAAQTIKNGIVDTLLWLFWVPFRLLLQILPLSLSYRVTCCIAFICSHLLAGMKKEISIELTKILSKQYTPAEIKKIAGESIQLYIQRRIEESFMSRFSKETIKATVSVEGEEFLKQAVNEGKGTIIMLSHFGSFLMILPALGFMGYPVNQLAGPPDLKHHRKINELIFKIRKKDYSRLPIKFLRSDLHIKTLFKALKNNELVAIAFDGRISNKWLPVTFFNRKAWFAPGPVKIAAKTGATILPTFIVRDKYNHHRLIFEPPVQLDNTVPDDDSLLADTRKIAAIFEKKIREYPAHFAIVLYINKKRTENDIEKSIFA